MVLFIGGASCSGKTRAAQRLMERLQIPYLSMDHVKMGLIRAGLADFTAEDPDGKITRTLWPVIREIAKTCVENDQHLIVEGCYLPETLDFPEAYRPFTDAAYIVFSERYIEERFEDGILRHCTAIENRSVGDLPGKAYFLEEHRAQKRRCEAASAKYFEIREDYERDLAPFFDWAAELAERKKTLRFGG